LLLVFFNIISTYSITQNQCSWNTQTCEEKAIHNKIDRKRNAAPLPFKTPFENKTTRIQKFYIMFKFESILKLFTYPGLIYLLIPKHHHTYMGCKWKIFKFMFKTTIININSYLSLVVWNNAKPKFYNR